MVEERRKQSRARGGVYSLSGQLIRWADWRLEAGFGGLVDVESKAGAACQGAALGITVLKHLSHIHIVNDGAETM